MSSRVVNVQQCKDDLQAHHRGRLLTQIGEPRTSAAIDRHPAGQHALTRLDDAGCDVETQSVRLDLEVNDAGLGATETRELQRARCGRETGLQRSSEELLGRRRCDSRDRYKYDAASTVIRQLLTSELLQLRVSPPGPTESARSSEGDAPERRLGIRHGHPRPRQDVEDPEHVLLAIEHAVDDRAGR